MLAPSTVITLIENFERNLDAYVNGHYNETQVRRDFIDPLFKALGWDMDNSLGYAEAYRDVIHEDTIKIGLSTRAPDYSFRVGGARKFFLEAKKPSVNVKEAAEPAFQLRRYGWSAKLPLSIVTNFEEFAVYDCRQKPNKSDKASKSRLFYCTFRDYAERWGEIAEIFSKDSVLKGSFDKYAVTTKGKRGTTEVDRAFLEEIEGWRVLLARNIALRNANLNQRELNFAVQQTIDRIIFLRICEDRGIEPYGRLQALVNGKDTYARLTKLFREADDRYNSGLFHFTEEKGRAGAPDKFTPYLNIDDKPLKEIFKSLYYPDCPYEFSVLGADILGSVYEQFLGKIIRLTAGSRAVVEDKPEVKKAGGVFYTPAYIVQYIVQHTVGKLLEGKTSKQTEGIRIVDPACGSGSFLIGAYQYLLDWYLARYIEEGTVKHSKGKAARIRPSTSGNWRLTTAEKKRLLLEHIYGVDIDTQAVEVTKLSLLLKVLEGESDESLNSQMKLFHDRVLPDLDLNIQCGNSLISPDFNDMKLELDDESVQRINVFDWQAAFPQVFNAGGFDAVIGNPPYVDIKSLPEIDVRYLFDNYSCSNNRINLFAAFIEKTLGLCKQKKFAHSMIVPTALLTQESYRALRKMIVDNYRVSSVVRLPNESFGVAAGDVKVDTAIFVFQEKNKAPAPIQIINYAGYERVSVIDPSTSHACVSVPHKQWSVPHDYMWSLNTGVDENKVLHKIESRTVPLEMCADFCLGLTPYDKYKGHTEDQIKGRVFHAASKKGSTFKPLLAGNDVGRYWVKWNGEQWINYGPWLGAARQQRFFSEQRIIVKQIIDWTSKRIWASITEDELYNTQNAFNLLAKQGFNLKYLLGIINSRLMTFYHSKKFLDEFKMRFQKILIKDARRFPIRVIEPTNKIDQTTHDKLVTLVDKMLTQQKLFVAAKLPQDAALLQRQIHTTDKQIDQLVYTLYGLTDKEIELVEGAGQ
ncbi:Eco57I restriction-modification methylase domain-containing protein [Pseudomonas farris]